MPAEETLPSPSDIGRSRSKGRRMGRMWTLVVSACVAASAATLVAVAVLSPQPSKMHSRSLSTSATSTSPTWISTITGTAVDSQTYFGAALEATDAGDESDTSKFVILGPGSPALYELYFPVPTTTDIVTAITFTAAVKFGGSADDIWSVQMLSSTDWVTMGELQKPSTAGTGEWVSLSVTLDTVAGGIAPYVIGDEDELLVALGTSTVESLYLDSAVITVTTGTGPSPSPVTIAPEQSPVAPSVAPVAPPTPTNPSPGAVVPVAYVEEIAAGTEAPLSESAVQGAVAGTVLDTSDTTSYVSLDPADEYNLYFSLSGVSTENVKTISVNARIAKIGTTISPFKVEIFTLPNFDLVEIGQLEADSGGVWVDVVLTLAVDSIAAYAIPETSGVTEIILRISSAASVATTENMYLDYISISLASEISTPVPSPVAAPVTAPVAAPVTVSVPPVPPTGTVQRVDAFLQFNPDWQTWMTLHTNNECDPMEWCRTDSACCSTATPVCGDGVCDEQENGGTGADRCPQDCSHDLAVCGNGICENFDGGYHKDRYEDEYSCPQDCAGDPNLDLSDPVVSSCFLNSEACADACGDGLCNGEETSSTCRVDCGAPAIVEGDGICSFPFEDAGSDDCAGTSVTNTLVHNGVTYATVDNAPPTDDIYVEADCTLAYTAIPEGWRLAAWDELQAQTLVSEAGAKFKTNCLVFSDGNAISSETATQGTNEDGCGVIPILKDAQGRVAINFENCSSRVLIQKIAGDTTNLLCAEACQNGGICNRLTGSCACQGTWTGPLCERGIGDFSVPSTATNNEWWKPVKGITWEWQIDGQPVPGLGSTPGTLKDVELFDIDYDYPAETVDLLKAAGKKVMCYISAGSYEEFRSDHILFPEDSLGGIVSFGEGDVFDDEKWLDLRRLDVIAPIMLDRLDVMKAKGCDAVEWDNADLPIHETGLPVVNGEEGRIHLSVQVMYNRWLAAQTHARGMGVAMKNNNEAAAFHVDDYDMVVNEECWINGNCDNYWPWLKENKPVLNTEYFTARCMYCDRANALDFSTIKKVPDLTECRVDCKGSYDLSQCVTAGYPATGVVDGLGNLSPPIDWSTMNSDWCPMTVNTNTGECPADRFRVCDPTIGY